MHRFTRETGICTNLTVYCEILYYPNKTQKCCHKTRKTAMYCLPGLSENQKNFSIVVSFKVNCTSILKLYPWMVLAVYAFPMYGHLYESVSFKHKTPLKNDASVLTSLISLVSLTVCLPQNSRFYFISSIIRVRFTSALQDIF